MELRSPRPQARFLAARLRIPWREWCFHAPDKCAGAVFPSPEATRHRRRRQRGNEHFREGGVIVRCCSEDIGRDGLFEPPRQRTCLQGWRLRAESVFQAREAVLTSPKTCPKAASSSPEAAKRSVASIQPWGGAPETREAGFSRSEAASTSSSEAVTSSPEATRTYVVEPRGCEDRSKGAAITSAEAVFSDSR